MIREGVREVKEKKSLENSDNKIEYLFTTKTCPNCRLVKTFLKDRDYVEIDAEEHPDLAMQYDVMQAPTYVVIHDGEVEKFSNASNIRKYIKDTAVSKSE